MATKMFVGDFLKVIKDLEEATDKSGVHLYDEMAIANYLGFASINDYNREVAKARTVYRELMIEKAKAMRDDGFTIEYIAEKLGVSCETARLLTDIEGAKRVQRVKKVNEEREKLFDKIDEDFKEQQKRNEELGKKLGWDFMNPWKL